MEADQPQHQGKGTPGGSRKNDEGDDALENVELAEPKQDEDEAPTMSRSEFQEQIATGQRAEFSEFPIVEASHREDNEKGPSSKKTNKMPPLGKIKPPLLRRQLVGSIALRDQRQSFWGRMAAADASQSTVGSNKKPHKQQKYKSDPYFDYSEANRELLTFDTGSGDEAIKVDIPSLATCQRQLQNKTADQYNKRSKKWYWRIADTVMNILAAVYIYLASICGFEAILVITNTVIATYYFCYFAEDYAVKLDFAFLSMAVVFPLTFLIQSTFSRRDAALSRLADFKSAVLSSVLFEFSVDWATKDGDPVGGRAQLPLQFNKNVLRDYDELLQLVYEYLSMPVVTHARHVVFFHKRAKVKHVHALQNDLLKQINDNMFDLMMHTEEMRSAGFPTGEASRLDQYHQYLQQRFEQLRILKYYRSPQATRSFGRAYIFVLPWLCGPYFAWVYESTSYVYSIVLAVFTFLILLGLLNTQQGLEDPFVADVRSWTPGIDSVKLDYELSVALQAICQYYANAELHRMWAMDKKGTAQL